MEKDFNFIEEITRELDVPDNMDGDGDDLSEYRDETLDDMNRLIEVTIEGGDDLYKKFNKYKDYRKILLWTGMTEEEIDLQEKYLILKHRKILNQHRVG